MMNYLITGAGSGIGQAICQQLAQAGHTCFLLGRNEMNLQKTLDSLNTSYHQQHTILCADVSSKTSLEKIVHEHSSLVLDGIIANAGVGGENSFGEKDRWNKIIETNLTGTYLTVQYFLPALKRSTNTYKHVLITSSVLARLGVANYAAYCASKAGLLGLMRSWAVQYAPNNILVNAICPGWVNTQMAQDGLQGIADGIGITKTEFYDMAMQSVPLKKMSEPAEIASLVYYLLNQQSITGQAIDINGGSVMNS
jgi:NAD(P)-dependent dehydrogenase (short-subunit alcohol dehydrogenase family)